MKYMKDPFGFIFLTIYAIIVGLISYWAWFSPKWYARFINFYKKFTKATSIIYPEEMMDFFCQTSGFSLWMVRIFLAIVLLISLRGIVYCLYGL